MEKAAVLEILIESLRENLELLKRSALEAKESATSEESKAENEYDTRGLEASYLAGAQAQRAAELMKTLQLLAQLKMKDFSEDDRIEVTALVRVRADGSSEKHLFLLPYGGGSKLLVGGKEVFIVTPTSPLGRALIGKEGGDEFELNVAGNVTEYEILSVQ